LKLTASKNLKGRAARRVRPKTAIPGIKKHGLREKHSAKNKK